MTQNNPAPQGGTPSANINILSDIGSRSNKISERDEIGSNYDPSEKIDQAITTLKSHIDSLATVYSDLLTISNLIRQNVGGVAPKKPPTDTLESLRRLRAQEIDQVWQQWLLALRAARKGKNARNPTLDVKRQNLVASRLRDGHAVDDLCKAVRGIWRSSWHRENDQVRFELALRDAGNIERFADLDTPLPVATAPVGKPPPRYKPTEADRALYGAESPVATSPPAAARPDR